MCYVKAANPLVASGIDQKRWQDKPSPPQHQHLNQPLVQQQLPIVKQERAPVDTKVDHLALANLELAQFAELDLGPLDQSDWLDEGFNDVFATCVEPTPTPRAPGPAAQDGPVNLIDLDPLQFASIFGSDLHSILCGVQTPAEDLIPWIDTLTTETMAAAAAPIGPPSFMKADQQDLVPLTTLFDPSGINIPAPQPPPSLQSDSSPRGQKRSSDSATDEEDHVTLKRIKNTEAARRSRARKVARLQSLENEVCRLERDKANMSSELHKMKAERDSSLRRESDLKRRVEQLENQLFFERKARTTGFGTTVHMTA